jgi:hypothetical protein
MGYKLLNVVCGVVLLWTSSHAFVKPSPTSPGRHRQKSSPSFSPRWSKDKNTFLDTTTAFFTPLLPKSNDKTTSTTKRSNPPNIGGGGGWTEEGFFDRMAAYAKRTVDDVLVEWNDNFKPTGTDKTWLGPLQGYANGIEAQLDEVSEWILSYSDLRPDSEKTLPGQLFLATNVAYALAGIYLAQNGDPYFGFLTEITAAASFSYHYGQLESNGVNNLPSVRLALLIDYILAFSSIGVAFFYLWTAGGDDAFQTVLPPALLAVGTLGASWIYEKGRPYMILHGLWHFFSAYVGYLVGNIHSGVV